MNKPSTWEDVTALGLDADFLAVEARLAGLADAGVNIPYFRAHDGTNNHWTRINGQSLINFSSYNYLALSGEHEISDSAKRAIDQFGTSVSASRIISGEIPLYAELERELSAFLGVQDCVLYVSGHATNVSTIGHLFDARDLILHDALIHNSVSEGCKLSGAKTIAFAHNNPAHAEHVLTRLRGDYRRVLIVVEGVYSMDGDIAPLPELVAIKQRHKALLMVDEAHSLGVLGATGRGVAEHFQIDPGAVDLWMGTLSKSLASCGGYIGGNTQLIRYLKFTSPGFVYSVGMPPASAAAALAALRLLIRQPERVQALRDRAHRFLTLARQRRLDTGHSEGTPIIPVIVGDSVLALKLAHELDAVGISVQPIIYPAVANQSARLRFSLSAQHSDAQLQAAVEHTADSLARLRACVELNHEGVP